MNNSEMSAETTADKSGAAEVTTSSHSSANTFVGGSCLWSFKSYTSALGDTGDYESCVQFTNGKDILQTNGDEIEDEQCQQFCELLELMPDLWSHKNDGNEFELSQIKKKVAFMEKALKTIRDAFWSEGETDKERIDDLKAIAFNCLYEIENGLF